jgi:hypothetical protein
MTQYRAVVGVDYPPNKRVEAGQLVDDLPEKSAKWLLSAGFIEAVDGKGKTITPVVEETVEEVIETPSVNITPAYDAEAKDGDNDGTVQDGTVWERPAGTELADEEIAKIVKGGE